MSVTSKDVAVRAKVSPITVSRVFNPRPNFPIAPATRERVTTAATELGYRPNRLARALVTGRTHVVSLHIPELSSYHAQIVRSLHTLMLGDEYEMIMLINPLVNGKREVLQPERRHFPSDGIVAIDPPGQLDTMFQVEMQQRVPLVSIATYPVLGSDNVLIDLYQGAQTALRHLIDVGARRIGYVVWDIVNKPGDPRRDAYDLVMDQTGRDHLYYPISWPARDPARRDMAAMIAKAPLPDALFCYSDDCAIGVFHALHDVGIRVPEDILLCGCDGLPDAEYLATPLTTVAQPIDTICSLGWTMLKSRIKEPGLSLRHETVTPQLLVRQSTLRH